MPVLRDLGKIARVTATGARGVARGIRATATGTTRASRWVGRNVGTARRRGGVGNVGMMRLLDLHAASCAGDTLVTIGLAGTIFFAAPAGEARGRVALYLFVTMVPFALLAPVVGPVLDRFRHGRRYALSATMLGRAVLAWLIADNIWGFGLYPAAFGVLALSRAYGVARSAAVPRLLPPGLGLSQAGARASVYGTVAGAIVAPLGAAAFWFGPQWPLRVASLIFLTGMVIALTLPPRADSDPPEVLPRLVVVPWRQREENGNKVLTGRLVLTALVGSAVLRALYGFLLVFLAFAIREHDIGGRLFGFSLNEAAAIGIVGSALALGTFAATAIGSSLRIRHPVRLQALWTSLVALVALWAAVRVTLPTLAAYGLVVAIASGLAKLAVDASIQERIPETVRASAFAHAETLLMLAWVAGAALGLIPFGDVRLGLAVVAVAVAATAIRAVMLAWRIRDDKLTGRCLDQSRVAAPRAGSSPTRPVRSPEAHGTSAQGNSAQGNSAQGNSAQGSGSGGAPRPDQTREDAASGGYHVFRPTTEDRGVSDPRIGA